ALFKSWPHTTGDASSSRRSKGRSLLRGHQMPSHWGKPELNIVTRSSTAGMQWLQAAGAAEASIYFERHPQAVAQAQQAPLGKSVRHSRDEIVYVSGGEGMTSQGE